MDITGKAYITKGEYGFYTTIKNKDNDKTFLNVGFRKGEEPETGGEINIEQGFLTVYKTNKGDIKFKLFIMSYEMHESSEGKHTSNNSNARTTQNNDQISPSGKQYPQGAKFTEFEGREPLPF